MKSITQSCSVCARLGHICTMCAHEQKREAQIPPRGIVRTREEREAEHER